MYIRIQSRGVFKDIVQGFKQGYSPGVYTRIQSRGIHKDIVQGCTYG